MWDLPEAPIQHVVGFSNALSVRGLADHFVKTGYSKIGFLGGESAKVGAPTVSGAKVVAEVVRHDRSRKVIVFKRKPGKYQKKNGHRQHFTTLKIKEVKA